MKDDHYGDAIRYVVNGTTVYITDTTDYELPRGIDPNETTCPTAPKCECGSQYIYDAPADSHSTWCPLWKEKR